MDQSTSRAAGAGIAIGAGFGGTIGLVAAMLADLGLTDGLVPGVGAGVLTGLLVGSFVDRQGEQLAGPILLARATAIGLVVGAGVGLIGAWGANASLAGGLTLGAGAGLIIGLVLGAVLPRTAVGGVPGGKNEQQTETKA